MYIRKAPEVFEMAMDIVHDESKHLGHLLGAHVHFFIANGLKGKGSLEYGKVEKVSGLLNLFLTGRINDRTENEPGDGFVVTVNGLLWSLITEERVKEQVLYNLLLRCGQDEDGKLIIAKPDIQAFTEEVHCYGADLPSVKRLLGILTDSGQEHIDFDTTAQSGEECPPELRLLTAGPPPQIEAYHKPEEAPIEADFVVVSGDSTEEAEAPRARARSLKAVIVESEAA